MLDRVKTSLLCLSNQKGSEYYFWGIEPEITELSIYLIIFSFKSRFSDFAGEDKREKLDKHRFMVQSKVLNDNEFSKISALQTTQRGEEVISLSV